MKKTYALTVIALLGSTLTHAQDAKSTKRFRLGLEVSPNMGWISTDVKGYESDGSRTGFRFGLLGDVQLGDNANYFFSTGLFLNNVGFKTSTTIAAQDSIPAFTSKGESKLQYIELPIAIKLKTNEVGFLTYFGQVGFDVGILTAAKVKNGNDDFADASDFVAPLRVALAVGGGLEYNFSGNTSALVGVKYSNGFTNVNKDKASVGGIEFDQPKAKLHYFELTLGVLF